MRNGCLNNFHAQQERTDTYGCIDQEDTELREELGEHTPMVGPKAVPNAAMVLIIPMVFPFCCMGMYAVTFAGAIAVIMAPPMAWNAREPPWPGNEVMRSGRRPQGNEPKVKITKPEERLS